MARRFPQLALASLFELENAFSAAMVSGAMSLDALQGSDVPFDPRIHSLRAILARCRSRRSNRELLAGSQRFASHIARASVQDPYSLRCQPQVMGACLDLITQTAETLVDGSQRGDDNPLIFAGTAESSPWQLFTPSRSLSPQTFSRWHVPKWALSRAPYSLLVIQESGLPPSCRSTAASTPDS